MSDEIKVPKDVKRYPDGEPILVLRPTRPAAVTVALAQIAVDHNSIEAMHQAYEGDHTFLGFLVKRGGRFFAVDEDGLNPVELQAGDIFAAPSDVYHPH